MNLLKGLKKENIEALADLWENEDFQKLVELLRINQDNYGKLCLTRPNWESVQPLQWYATAFSIVIKTVENCYLKINKIKRRK